MNQGCDTFPLASCSGCLREEQPRPCGCARRGLRASGCAASAQPVNRAGEKQTPGGTSFPSIFSCSSSCRKIPGPHCIAGVTSGWHIPAQVPLWLQNPDEDRLGAGESQALACAVQGRCKPHLALSGPVPCGWQERRGGAGG